MGNTTDTKHNYICIGYVPLYYRSIQKDILEGDQDPYEFMSSRLCHTPPIKISACLYTNHHGITTPVLVCNKAKAVVEHLLFYSKGKPADRFRFYIGSNAHQYYIIIQPKVEKDILEYRKYHKLPDNTQVQVLMKHLVFTSHKINSLKKYQGAKSIYVGFIDETEVDYNDAQTMPEPIFIGPFDVKDGKDINIRKAQSKIPTE
jgi:hypothetical protein